MDGNRRFLSGVVIGILVSFYEYFLGNSPQLGPGIIAGALFFGSSSNTVDKKANKLIERTAKHDAYEAVYMWARGGNKEFKPVYGDAAWYAKEKMEGHASWLAQQKYEYEFSTSTFVERKK